MEPPPAPTVWMDTVGMRQGYPPTSVCCAITGSPDSIRQTSVEVPPMSKEIARSSPSLAASSAAAATPPAGPDNRMVVGFAAAVTTGATPPFDRMINSSVAMSGVAAVDSRSR